MASITLKSSKFFAAGSLVASALAISVALVREPLPLGRPIAVNPPDGWYFLARSACSDFDLYEDKGDFTALHADYAHVENTTGGGKFRLNIGLKLD